MLSLKEHLMRCLSSAVAALLGAASLVSTAHAQVSTPGSFAVSPSGAATYTVPIQVPPGVGGLAPNLALVYNSQGGNGLLGVGWSLSGLSSITRCPRTMAQDVVRGSVNYDLNDRYCLDGQRLIAVKGTDGGDGTEYRTESDDYSRITSYAETGATNGPGSFIVKTRSGLTMEFGKTADSRIEAQGKATVIAWALNKVRDDKGRYYTVSYTEDNANGQFYPASIYYAGTSLATPNLSVQFAYENRTDVSLIYFLGTASRTTVRLNQVKALSGSAAIKGYAINYSYSPATSRSILRSVTECSGSGVCSPATTFGVQGIQSKFQDMFSSPGISGSFVPTSSGTNNDYGTFIDVNGDGISDYVVVWNHSGLLDLCVYPGKQDGTFGNLLCSYIGGNFTPRNSTSNQDVGTFADVNGDGIPDYVVVWSNGGKRNIATYLARGDGTFNTLVNTEVDGNFGFISAGSNQDPGMFVDVNGDGRADYVVVWNYSGTRAITVYMAKDDGTFNNSVWGIVDGNFIPQSTGMNLDVGTFQDVNGDGFPDYVVVWNNAGNRSIATYLGNGNGSFQKAIKSTVDGYFGAITTGSNQDSGVFADVNGDGLPDYVVVWSNAGQRAITAYLARGDGTFNNSVYSPVGGNFAPTAPGYNQDSGLFSDVNGDGIADYVLSFSNAGQRAFAVYLGQADGSFGPSNTYIVSVTSGSFTPISAGSYQDTGVLADANGDGLPDYVVVWNNGGNRAIVTHLGLGAFPDLINSFSNGVSGSTTISYLPMSSGARYQKGAGSVYPVVDLKTPMQVVGQVSGSNGVGGTSTADYYFGALRIQVGPLGRGSLGFQWMQSKDVSTGLVSRTYYRQDFPFIGQVDKVGRGTSEADWYNLGLTTYKYTFKAFGPTDADYASPVTCVDDPSTGRPLKSCTDSAIKPGNRYVPYTHEVLDKNSDWSADQNNVFIALPQTRTTTTQDNWGNATQIKVETLKPDGSASGHSKTTSTVFAEPDKVNWRLGRVIKSSVTSSSP